MNNMRRLLPLILLVLTSSVFALGGREKAVVIQITGVVRLIGSNPLPQLVISGVDYDWYITAEEDLNKLHAYQQRSVTVEGEETTRELTFANGQPAGTRRELRSIRIISVN